MLSQGLVLTLLLSCSQAKSPQTPWTFNRWEMNSYSSSSLLPAVMNELLLLLPTRGSCVDFSEGACDLSENNIVGHDRFTDTPAECQVDTTADTVLPILLHPAPNNHTFSTTHTAPNTHSVSTTHPNPTTIHTVADPVQANHLLFLVHSLWHPMLPTGWVWGLCTVSRIIIVIIIVIINVLQ